MTRHISLEEKIAIVINENFKYGAKHVEDAVLKVLRVSGAKTTLHYIDENGNGTSVSVPSAKNKWSIYGKLTKEEALIRAKNIAK